jgi:predicted acylesterase/phospholipase RssA
VERAPLPLTLAFLAAGTLASAQETPVSTETVEDEIGHVVGAMQGAKDEAEGDHPRASGPITVLALSGGGQWGAFGAGFLKGWGERPDHSRPSFDVVTGTSTGALIATFAFLASADCGGGVPCDQKIVDEYLDFKTDSDVFSKRFFLTLFWKDSLATRKQFRRHVDQAITADVVGKVANEAKAGRVLLVGATDILSGKFHYFDLTRLAAAFAREPDARKREGFRQGYVDRLMASSAVPVAFEPVWVKDIGWKRSLYVDGGTRRNIFIEALKRFSRSEERDIVVYCLFNGARGVDSQTEEELHHGLKLLGMAHRSVGILLDESTEGNLFRIFWEMNHLPSGQKGEVLFTAIDKRIQSHCHNQLKKSEEDQFDYAVMKCLAEQGEATAQGDPWQKDPLKGTW